MASRQPPPPARPWFRFASIRPPPPPPTIGSSSNPQPDPVLAPIRPVIRPAFYQPFRPPPPQEPTLPPPPAQLPLNRVSPPPPQVTTPPLPQQQLPVNRVSPPPPPRSLPEIAPSRSPPPSLQQLPLNRSSSPQPPQQRSLPSPPPPQPPLARSSPPPTATPTSPVIKTSSPPNASSPSPPPAVQTTTATATIRSPNPPSSPSPSPSPNIRHISHPPSPLTLPPAQLNTTEPQFKIPQEPEQKTVLVQQTTEKSKLTNGTSSNNTDHKYVNGSTRNPPKVSKEDNKGIYKKSSDSEDYRMKIITIAGENKGAIMELNPSKKNNDNKNIPRAWNSDGENSKKGYNNDYKPPSSYVNSNVQGINNSIILNASCSHHDPGVHLSVSTNGNGGRGFHMKEKMLKD